MGAIAPDVSHAQLGKLKDKIKKEVEKKVEKPKEAEKPAEEATDSSEAKPAPVDSSKGDDFQLYTKFDFVPGQKVLFLDDLAGEETGEFPSRWKLVTGVFEIAQVKGENWIMGSARGEIVPKLNVNQFPEKYTIEFEFLNRTSVYTNASHVDFTFHDSTSYPCAHLRLYANRNAYFYMKTDDGGGGETSISDKKLPESFASGSHQIRFMVTKSSIKGYVDNERLVNAPRSGRFLPVRVSIGIEAGDTDFEKEGFFFRNFRFAEGGKTMREQLDENGKIVTHGIYFDVNSDKIKGESYKTLADIAQMLADDSALRLKIEGHTDSDGTDAANLELSERRAKSVRSYLLENYKIADDQLESKGRGEEVPIDANTTPEGKANNRRVELVKL
jgi:outer membrane protein OmpA-like peptidoglycan-associated protein